MNLSQHRGLEDNFLESVNHLRVSNGLTSLQWLKGLYDLASKETEEIMKTGTVRDSHKFETEKHVFHIVNGVFNKVNTASTTDMLDKWISGKERYLSLLAKGDFTAVSISETDIYMIVSQFIATVKRDPDQSHLGMQSKQNSSAQARTHGIGNETKEESSSRKVRALNSTLDSSASVGDSNTFLENMAKDVFNIWSSLREESGLSELHWDKDLVRISKQYCQDVIESGVDIEGSKFWPVQIQMDFSGKRKEQHAKLVFEELYQFGIAHFPLANYEYVGISARSFNQVRSVVIVLFNTRPFNSRQ